MIELNGETLKLAQVQAIADGANVSLNPSGLARMAEARKLIDAAVRDRTPVYGVTTGLGPRVVEGAQ